MRALYFVLALAGCGRIYFDPLDDAKSQCVWSGFTRAADVANPEPLFVAAGDLDRDGKIDLVTDRRIAALADVYYGVGDGTFSAGPTLTTASGPQRPVIADFNRDGNQDIAIVDGGAGSIGVWLGAGARTFGPRVDYPLGGTPLSCVARDLDGDQIVDLAIDNTITGMGVVDVLIGVGDGTFATKVDYAANTGGSLVSADLDSNGTPDLLDVSFTTGLTSALLNNGNGTFQPKIDSQAGPTPGRVAVGDLDADGHPDIAVAGNFSTDGLLLYGGVGNGSFKQPASATSPGQFYGIAIVDIDQDGALDVLTTSASSSVVTVFRGNKTLTLGAGIDTTAAQTPYDIATADFNGDGVLDLAVPANASGPITILLGTCAL